MYNVVIAAYLGAGRCNHKQHYPCSRASPQMDPCAVRHLHLPSAPRHSSKLKNPKAFSSAAGSETEIFNRTFGPIPIYRQQWAQERNTHRDICPIDCCWPDSACRDMSSSSNRLPGSSPHSHCAASREDSELFQRLLRVDRALGARHVDDACS